ncbi:SNARE associated Golgi protein-related protein [Denitrovibrio acetiphilus DSM 12809]|uniref:TVP38/TMEM64 family membrane protein n=1 Tax=Denitrovibrio acetiphilus (strain DSM 12809 / NBRC 114555 / N2460) TaxID=522772 RepID=D4H818_DENA2|nr:TVP38/TMEM64 family protein [Denitrovibrio acetiphilus]ADD68167.1 SNARE associated Golgi protein-related protein [Denitrovibrio acetiphilus DSM 12809]
MIKKLIVLVIIIAAALWLRQSEYAELLTLEALKANGDALRIYVADHYISSVGLYVVIYMVVAGLNIPGAVILSIGGGYVFGAIAGTVFAVTSATLGAGIGFLTARYIMGSSLNVKYAKQLQRLNRELETNGYLYMLTLRLIPAFPYFLINILAGLTKLRFGTFIWTSYIGMIPGGFVFVYAGSRLNNISSLSDIFSPEMLSAFVLLGALMLIPVAYKKIKRR